MLKRFSPGSVISTQTIESRWTTKRFDDNYVESCEDIGISAIHLTQRRQFIIVWIKEAVKAVSSEESVLESVKTSSQVSSALNRSAGGFATKQLAMLTTKPGDRDHPLSKWRPKSARPSSLRASYLIFKLFQSNAELHHS